MLHPLWPYRPAKATDAGPHRQRLRARRLPG